MCLPIRGQACQRRRRMSMQVRIKATLGIAAVLGVALVMTVGILTPAQASALLPTTSFAGTAVPVHSPIARFALLWPGAPDGCPDGAVCFYRQGNGGELCEPLFGSAPNLGECANIGPSGTIYNNG